MKKYQDERIIITENEAISYDCLHNDYVEALHEAGIENWSGYTYAMEIWRDKLVEKGHKVPKFIKYK